MSLFFFKYWVLKWQYLYFSKRVGVEQMPLWKIFRMQWIATDCFYHSWEELPAHISRLTPNGSINYSWIMMETIWVHRWSLNKYQMNSIWSQLTQLIPSQSTMMELLKLCATIFPRSHGNFTMGTNKRLELTFLLQLFDFIYLRAVFRLLYSLKWLFCAMWQWHPAHGDGIQC